MPPRHFGMADLFLLLLVLAVALGVRCWYVWEWADRGSTGAPVTIQGSQHKELAQLLQHLRDEQRFLGPAPFAATDQPTAFDAPGYASLAYVVASVPGEGWEARLRWTQAGLGALTAVCYFGFAWFAFGRWPVALLAGLLCACHPFWVGAVTEINDGVLTAFLLGLSLFLGAWGARDGSAAAGFFFGLALALLALTRAALLPFGLIALAWFLFHCRTLPRGWLCATLAFLGFANAGVPWAVRNYQDFHDVLPIVDSTYYHLWVGNNPNATGGPATAAAQASIANEELAGLPEPQRFARLAPLVLREVQENPSATLRRRLWAGFCFLVGEDWLTRAAVNQTPALENNAEFISPAMPAVLSGVLLAMLLLGPLGWHCATDTEPGARLAALALLLIPLPYLLGHAEALQGPRLPLDGVLLSYTAFALLAFLPEPLGEEPAGERRHDEATS